ncbi:MAG TPA: nucleotidyltransferase domain-containing protein [Oleiagrimonas sp.]|nr:nucleotidyltransferase domain-containing protein [Oleiagrimonas sp.]
MTIRQARAALASHPEIKLAIVFGSVASGRARADSDIDIAVQADKPLTAQQTTALVEDLALATGRAVDLIDLRRTGEPLLGEILRHGQRIVGSDHDLAELRLRHVYFNEDFMPYVRRMLEERNRRWLQ